MRTQTRRPEEKTPQPDNQRSSGISRTGQPPQDFQALTEGVYNAVEDYGMRHPATVATAIFFLGFYVGWKVKPW